MPCDEYLGGPSDPELSEAPKEPPRGGPGGPGRPPTGGVGGPGNQVDLQLGSQESPGDLLGHNGVLHQRRWRDNQSALVVPLIRGPIWVAFYPMTHGCHKENDLPNETCELALALMNEKPLARSNKRG